MYMFSNCLSERNSCVKLAFQLVDARPELNYLAYILSNFAWAYTVASKYGHCHRHTMIKTALTVK